MGGRLGVPAGAQLPGRRGCLHPVTWASLQADLLAAHERSARLAARIRQLGQLKLQVTRLAEENQQLCDSLAGRDQDLTAARAASRELMARLNTRS